MRLHERLLHHPHRARSGRVTRATVHTSASRWVTVDSMASLAARLRSFLSPAARTDRRNIHSLAVQLGASVEDAEWVYRRSREVGHGAAMLEWEALCRERDARR